MGKLDVFRTPFFSGPRRLGELMRESDAQLSGMPGRGGWVGWVFFFPGGVYPERVGFPVSESPPQKRLKKDRPCLEEGP